MTTATVAPEARRTRSLFVAGGCYDDVEWVRPADPLSIGDVLALLPRLPDWPTATEHREAQGSRHDLNWLLAHPGEGWQDRRTVSGADHDTTWIDTLAPRDTSSAATERQEHVAGLACLLMCRVVLPSYDFQARAPKAMKSDVAAGAEGQP